MEGCALFLTLFLSLALKCSTRSIRDEIRQNQMLTKLENYMEGLDIWSTLGRSNVDITFFAPIDAAFKRIPAKIQRDLLSSSTSTSHRLDGMFENHAVIGRTIMSTDFGDQTLNSMNHGGKLYLRNVEGEKFVSGARFNATDIQCDNGVMHIIDTFLHEELKTHNAFLVIEEMTQNTDARFGTSRFKRLLETWKDLPTATTYWDLNGSHEDKFVTVFVPSDNYMDPLADQNAGGDPNFFLNLERNTVELQRVIESHIIVGGPEAVYHSNVLEHVSKLGQSVVAAQGTIVPNYFNKQLYVSNNCAQGAVLGANLTVGNGVIHMIEGMLGYLYYDMDELLRHHPTFNELEGYAGMASQTMQARLRVEGSGLVDVPETEKYTLFAPIDSAFRDIQRNVDFSTTQAQVDTLFELHMLEGQVKVAQMTNSSTFRTLKSGKQAKFYNNIDGTTWVEVDHVRGQIIQPNYCVQNGIIHFVDHVLGIPHFTIYEYIVDRMNQPTPELTELYQIIQQTGYRNFLDDDKKNLTFFAPTDEAIRQMREGAVGREFLDPRSDGLLQTLLRRHFFGREVFVDSITNEREFTSNAGTKLKLYRDIDSGYYLSYEGKRINILSRDERMRNGVINIITGVAYEEVRTDMLLASSCQGLLQSLSSLLCLISIFHIILATAL